jgi:HlyD family secretion protein
MYIRFLMSVVLAFVFVAGSLPGPLPNMHPAVGGLFAPTAQAKSKVRSLLDRVLGKSMPEGIVKTNGRIEATQVDVAAKYPGRLVDITVEEGSEVKAGQVVGRVSSPEYEAQLRAAQSNVERAKQSMAEAESLIDQRNATLAAAKSDFERGEQLIKNQTITQQTFDQRRRNY